MNVEEALASLGTIGRWQITYFTLISIFQNSQATFQMLVIIWIGHTPQHHCRVSEGASLNDSIPLDSNGKLSQCLKYVNLTLSNQTMACDDGWVYDLTDSYTIVNKWNSVCDNKLYSHLPQAILVIGSMVGAFVSSVLSDKFGRKPVFMSSHMMMVVAGVVCAFVDNYYVFLCLRFIIGMLQQALILTGFVLLSEMFSLKQRIFATISNNCFWGGFAALLAFFAYLLPNWVHLQLLISLSGLLSIPLFWTLSESVSWQYANGHIEKAEKTIRKAAKMNKIKMPDVIFEIGKLPNLKKGKSNGDSYQYDTQYSLLDLFKSRKLTLYLIVTSFMWMVVTSVYYGLSLTTGDLKGNRFLNGFFNAIIEVPAYLLAYLLVTKFGRKKPLFLLFVLCGVSVLLIPFLPETNSRGTNLSYLPRTFNVLGKFCITGSFGIMFLYVSELFPTNLRNQAIGVSSCVGRLGNIPATFSTFAFKQYPKLTSLVIAGLTFIAALSVLLLPETKGCPLPTTIQEIESLTKTTNGKKNEKKERTDLKLIEYEKKINNNESI